MKNLPQAPGYQFIDPHLGRTFNTRGRNIDLDRITDATIEALLDEEPNYWSQKFEKKKATKAKKKATNDADE